MIELDADPENADWTKASWDLPPYGSKEFYEVMGPDYDDDHFKTTPVYLNAVTKGLIHDDEWVGDYVTDALPQAPKPKSKGKIFIHHH